MLKWSFNAHKSLQSNLLYPTPLKSKALSLPEVLLALLVIGMLGISALKSVVALKSQNKSMQNFLLYQSGIFETQIFLNKYFALIQPNSLSITHNAISWQGYDDLFLPNKDSVSQDSDIMDFSLQTTPHLLKLQDNILYFDNALLLENVSVLDAQILNTNTHKILTYKLCAKHCINDFVILEESEIML